MGNVDDICFYLDLGVVLSSFRSIPRHCKYHEQAYATYLEHLLSYLQNFFQRTNRLTNHEKVRPPVFIFLLLQRKVKLYVRSCNHIQESSLKRRGPKKRFPAGTHLRIKWPCTPFPRIIFSHLLLFWRVTCG